MRNVHTLKDISSGHRLGSAREIELEEMLCNSIKSISELTNEYNDMQGVYSSYCKRNDRDKAKLHHNLEQAETNNRKLSDCIHQLIDEMSQLQSEMDSLNFQITRKDISLADSKDKLATKSKEIKALQSKLKALEKNFSLAQINLSEMNSLRLELEQARDDLSSKNYEMECMEKGIESSDSMYKRALDSLYSVRSNLMEENSHLREMISKKELRDTSHNEVDTPLPPINNLSQPSALNSSTFQTISVGDVEAVSLPATAPIIASSLMSLMLIYIILTLLILAIIWLVVGKKYGISGV
jgi:chromosome segregation ATPase